MVLGGNVPPHRERAPRETLGDVVNDWCRKFGRAHVVEGQHMAMSSLWRAKQSPEAGREEGLDGGLAEEACTKQRAGLRAAARREGGNGRRESGELEGGGVRWEGGNGRRESWGGR